MITANNWSRQMKILGEQGFNNRVKVFKVLMKNKGDVNAACAEIQGKSKNNPKKFKLENEGNPNKEARRSENPRIPY